MNTPTVVSLRPCLGTQEWPGLVAIWRSAVEATHDFLTTADIDSYESQLATNYFPQVAAITVATAGDSPVGFSAITRGNLDMLFIDDRSRGRGVGSALIREALGRHPNLALDVNEQNPQAVGFYRSHGFVIIGRSATDDDGRPFPILHMVHRI